MNHALTPEQLMAVADKTVSKKMFKQVMTNKYFKDFMRIFIFMTMNTSEGTVENYDPSIFGHSLIMTRKDGKQIEVLIDIKMTPKEYKAPEGKTL